MSCREPRRVNGHIPASVTGGGRRHSARPRPLRCRARGLPVLVLSGSVDSSQPCRTHPVHRGAGFAGVSRRRCTEGQPVPGGRHTARRRVPLLGLLLSAVVHRCGQPKWKIVSIEYGARREAPHFHRSDGRQSANCYERKCCSERVAWVVTFASAGITLASHSVDH